MRCAPSPMTSSRYWISFSLSSLSPRSVFGRLQRLQVQSKPKLVWRCLRRNLKGPVWEYEIVISSPLAISLTACIVSSPMLAFHVCWQFGRQAWLILEACKKSPPSVASGPNGRVLVLAMPRKGPKEPRKLLWRLRKARWLSFEACLSLLAISWFMRSWLFPIPENVKMGFSDRIRLPFETVWAAMSPRPFFGIDLTIYKVRSAVVSTNPALSVREMFNVGLLIKEFEVVHMPGGCWAVKKRE